MLDRKRPYKRSKKSVVQLTSLLDLLFVMVFVSLLQQKNIPAKTEEKPKPKAAPIVQENVKEKKKPIAPKVENALVSATFTFTGNSSNPNSANGSYEMQGTFEADSRYLSLLGLKWLDRPSKDYGMVPLEGNLNESFDLFSGRIQFLGCKPFKLKKTLSIGTKPYSGRWEGRYDCAQGLTELVLTIK